MFTKIYFYIFFSLVTSNKGWRAVPANQAMYSARRQLVLEQAVSTEGDELLPRTSIHSTYKFGWCAPGSSSRVYLRKSTTFSLPTWESVHANYIYVIEPKDSIRYRLQCVVLRMMVPRKYLFRRSRVPLYYCQGYAYFVMFLFTQRMEIHEFYLHQHLDIPADFIVEFYHPKEM